MAAWLLKTEPSTYSHADLARDRITRWDGVKNPVAQRNLRAMAPGDTCVVYHTGNEKAAVGLAKVERAPFPDPASPALHAVDLVAGLRFARAVTLAEIKSLPAFADSPLVRQGRLSVVALTDAQLRVLVARAQ